MRAKVAVFLTVFVALSGAAIPSFAGTTGGIAGHVVDATTHAALADVKVIADSPSQVATATTDANGNFQFLSLAPDAYTLSFTKNGYDSASQPGISVFADQVQTITVTLHPSLKTIATVRSRAAGDVVRPGTTSDVYSVNAAGQRAATGLSGPGSLNNAYGAIQSVPGVALDAGEQGWWQTVHIRGGDIDQIGYELDGIPVNRAYDNAPQTMLSSLGQQELQVYTGGTPATADAQGIAGYINQVVKTGTYPGFMNWDLGLGGPSFYHKASFEFGGADAAHRFSYYVGLSGADQGYNYFNNSNNGAGNSWFFYPVNAVPGCNGSVFTGDDSCFGGIPPTIDPSMAFTSGLEYGLAYTAQRDNVVNLHYGIPHGNGLRDDIQFLWLTSEVNAQYFSSQNDTGLNIDNYLFGPMTWDDAWLYKGPLMAKLNPSDLTTYLFNSSPQNRAQFNPLPLNQRDTNDNGVAVSKLQFQHAFSPSAFFRVYGYTLYSNWFIYGPNSASQPFYGTELADYEIPNHTWGVNASFTDQLSSKHLLTVSGVYTATNLQRYSASFYSGGTSRPIAFLMDGTSPKSNCYSPTTGLLEACYEALASGDDLGGSAVSAAAGGAPLPAPPAGSPAALAAAQWVAVDKGLTANLNQVHPRFSGFSLTDQWRPSDRWTVNGGLRVENFRYLLGDTGANDPARQFWFYHYNLEHCYAPGSANAPVLANGNGLGGCPAGQAVNLVNSNPPDIDTARWQPRLGFTYSMNPETVVRGSFGVYARPQNTSWVQYNTVQEDLPLFLGSHFYSYNFTTPTHEIRPDTSYNYDLSLEKRLHGTDWSFKLTPYLRSTRDQLQNFFIDPVNGLESGLNVGSQTSYGLEVALRKGDFNNDGWSGQLSYTYTHSRIRYQNFPGTNRNIIDNLNAAIQDYNGYTAQCAGHPSNNPASPCFYPGYSGSGTPALQSGTAPSQCYVGGAPGSCSVAGAVANPYWNSPVQPLLDRNGDYTTYDVIPGPWSAENGFETPNVFTMLINYKHDRFSVTPTLNYTSGASYGAPLSWPGYRPETCAGTLAGTTKADPVTCTDAGLLPVFLPDPFNGNQFDTLGAFKQPWRVSLSMNMSYEISPTISADLLLTNIVDYCGQRGYAWDQADVCVYSAPPSNFFAPGGNFFPNSIIATVPVQMKYPYDFWLNNNNTGFIGVKLPFQATFNVHIKM
ncbi:MAG TPA: TonB-dependent receptor [Candidatus Baltobacteraceae bacterium]|jgi:hypothetical protein|nr:TonB-dependent receptor [Candidatus Baltobacteraceae bacterium]